MLPRHGSIAWLIIATCWVAVTMSFARWLAVGEWFGEVHWTQLRFDRLMLIGSVMVTSGWLFIGFDRVFRKWGDRKEGK